ncbi:MAG: hypothetical protein ABFD20_02375, partial [Anaerolineales bacterium]
MEPPYVDVEVPAIGMSVDTPQQAGIQAGESTAILSPEAEAVQFEGMPLGLRVKDEPLDGPLGVRARIQSPDIAAELSPAGLVFELAFAPEQEKDSPLWSLASDSPPISLQLEIDYSQFALEYRASFAERLILYRGSDCRPTQADDGSESSPGYSCVSFGALPAYNDGASGRLLVELAASPELASMSAEPTPDLPPRSFVPVSMAPHSSTNDTVTAQSSGPTFYILGSGAAGPQGDFSATPFSFTSDYQVDLFTGAATTRYPIPVPPSAAGPAPQVELVYDSG